MIQRLIKSFFQILAIASFSAAVYFNIYVVESEHIGLLIEKTTGLDKPFLKPGRHWLWTGFVPNKWKFISIDANPSSQLVTLEQPMRFSEYLKNSDRFTFKINLSVKYELNNESISYFWKVLDGNLKNIPKYVTERARIHLESKMLTFLKTVKNMQEVEILFREYLHSPDAFPDDWKIIFSKENIYLSKFDVLKIYAPDEEVYRTHLRGINRILEAETESVIEEIHAQTRVLEKKLLDQADLEKAQKFSKLIDKKPGLLKYYQIEKVNPKANTIIVPQKFPGQSSDYFGGWGPSYRPGNPDRNQNNESGEVAPIQKEN